MHGYRLGGVQSASGYKVDKRNGQAGTTGLLVLADDVYSSTGGGYVLAGAAFHVQAAV